MVADTIQELLEIGFGRDRVHHETVLRSVSGQSIQVALERLVMLVRLLKDDSDVSGVEIKSCVRYDTGIMNDLFYISRAFKDVEMALTVLSPAKPDAAFTASFAVRMYSATSGVKS